MAMNHEDDLHDGKEKRTYHEWHLLFGRLLELTLTPLGIEICKEFKVSSASPRVDVLLLRNQKGPWTAEQLAALPDGLRHSNASHFLIEFKYSESINEKALTQTLIYDYLYRNGTRVAPDDVATFLVGSKQPTPETLRRFGFASQMFAGVYRTQHDFIKPITLISLNELADHPHNAAFKLFASKNREKLSAINRLKNHPHPQFRSLVYGLMDLLKEKKMTVTHITPDYVIERGRILLEELFEKEKVIMRQQLRIEVKAEVKAELEDQVRAEVEEQIKAEVEEQIKAEVEEQIKAEVEERTQQFEGTCQEDHDAINQELIALLKGDLSKDEILEKLQCRQNRDQTPGKS